MVKLAYQSRQPKPGDVFHRCGVKAVDYVIEDIVQELNTRDMMDLRDRLSVTYTHEIQCVIEGEEGGMYVFALDARGAWNPELQRWQRRTGCICPKS